jgi:uncharacterized protein (DUF924 family)
MADPETVLSFWFGDDPSEAGLFAGEARWWRKDPAFDAEIRQRFEPAVHAAATGALDAWRQAPRSCVAFVILLDQFPRNLYRGTPRSFGFDTLALAASLHAQAAGLDRALPCALRQFLYMPMMHAEDVHVQRRSVQAFTDLAEHAPAEVAATCRNSAAFASRHAAIVERFGRFPHRNALLGRASTLEEAAFLEQPGSSF